MPLLLLFIGPALKATHCNFVPKWGVYARVRVGEVSFCMTCKVKHRGPYRESSNKIFHWIWIIAPLHNLFLDHHPRTLIMIIVP